MCRRTKCPYAISCNQVNVVLHCSFYPSLNDLPDDCKIPEILRDITTGADEIIELTKEMLIE